ncbi:bifunctional DNA-formamidopyrimidine glycosylase/DNA-(apurinic or apyrimidinic site) lyase [Candidatus Beckwithbacteria bacterium]|nr:bifunctional DNA-formamidopyrimidine glycosylase/DNA-(apurinic or apyrimidinic site) lyase [Candidatus Beckwithbacteria bacterium]
MPELPEVETLKRQLQQVIIGKIIAKIDILKTRSFVGNPKLLIGRKIEKIERKAKVLLFSLDHKDWQILIHLKMTGQLIYEGVQQRIVGGHPTPDWIAQLPSKHTRIIFYFTDKSTLYFNDMRIFGWIKFIQSRQELEKEFINMNGIEPLNKYFTWQNLQKIFAKSKRSIKLMIMDPKYLVGVGNIYANDALFKAKINPQKPAKNLSLPEIKKLKEAIEFVISQGIKYGGASQTNYVHLDGMGGSYQKHFLVYKKDRQACPNCQGNIKKIKLGGRGTFFCPSCQK